MTYPYFNPEHPMPLGMHTCLGAECPHCAVLPVGRVTFAAPSNKPDRLDLTSLKHGIASPVIKNTPVQWIVDSRLFHMRDSLGHIPASYPKALLPSITAIIRDDRHTGDGWRVLVHQRRDNQQWGFVGGAQNLGESIIETVHREVREETGLEVRIDGLVCVDSDPTQGAICSYDDGNVHYTNLCFACTWIGGELRCSDESLQLAWCAVGDVPQPFLGTHAWRLQEWSKSNMRGHRGVTVR